MSSLEISAPPVMAVPRLPRTWYFLGTTVIGLIAYGVMNLAEVATLLLLLARHAEPVNSQAELQALLNQGGSIAAATIAACPFVLGVLWVAIRIARRRFASYLALRWPVRGELVRGLAISFAFLLAWDLLSYLTGQKTPAFAIDSYRTAKDAGALPLVLVGFCVAAPITEEFAVRGFLFRGWSRSFLGPIGAILLSSALWAAMHVQYDWYYVCEVFLIGLIFGYLRHRSGSTWLTVITHGFCNLAILGQTAWIVARL
jgi:membrane protease YdiL (CAAX protease family)